MRNEYDSRDRRMLWAYIGPWWWCDTCREPHPRQLDGHECRCQNQVHVCKPDPRTCPVIGIDSTSGATPTRRER